jgi:hypothetical protein
MLFFLLVGEGQVAAPARVPVRVGGHKDARAAARALLLEAGHLAGVVDLVVLEDRQLDGLVLVGDALGGGEDLLLALLGASPQAKDKVEGRLLLDVVVGKGAAILELLARKDEALLIRGDSLLVLDLLLHILNGVAGLDIEGDGLARQRLDEDLHPVSGCPSRA